MQEIHQVHHTAERSYDYGQPVLEKKNPGTQARSILLPVQLLPSYVMLGKSLNLQELRSPHLKNEGEEDRLSQTPLPAIKHLDFYW